jgi:hypothetical protein
VSMTRPALLAAMLLAACSSGGSSSPDGGSSSTGPFDTTISSSLRLSELSSSQQQTLCEEFQAFATSTSWDDVIEGGCRLGGIIAATFSNPQDDAALQAACMTTYEQCKSVVNDPSTTADVDCTPDSGPWTCSATVGEVITCLNDTVTELANILLSIPMCSEVTLADVQGDAGISFDLQSPPSCQALQAKCPASAKRGALRFAPPATR